MIDKLFAHPVFLLALAAAPVATAFALFAGWRRRVLLTRVGNVLLLRRATLVRPRVRRWKAVCFLTALSFLAIACAGPQWGFDRGAQTRKGRDVIVVFDLSRSMLAEQPSRRELAIRSLRRLADAFEQQGGNRVALIGFASQARLFFPLTQDYNHLRHTLLQIEADDYPALSSEEPVSGTRIGAALSLAVASRDSEHGHRPVIMLLSDGDDPAGDDEWLTGVAAAQAKKIHVHAVGFGNPREAEPIPVGREVLLYEGKPVRTKLNEKLLQEIALRTGGVYLAARTEEMPLGAVVQQLLDAQELRADQASDDALPVYQLRYAWFLLPAIGLLMLAMFLSEGPPARKKEAPVRRKSPRVRARTPALAAIVLAILNVSAADPPGLETLVRQGNEAFARQEYEAALGFFERAETLATDPGLVSFNKGAALYRLGRYKEAIECYRRALEDDAAPAARRGRGQFDLGNALLKHAGDNPHQLAEAVAAYRAALHVPALPPNLQGDARHNLELAQLLWLKARQNRTDRKNTDPGPRPKPKYPDDNDPDPKKADGPYVRVEPGHGTPSERRTDLPAGGQAKNLKSSGIPQVLPDDDKIRPLSPEDTLTTLAEHARRIAEARRREQHPDGPISLSTKDW